MLRGWWGIWILCIIIIIMSEGLKELSIEELNFIEDSLIVVIVYLVVGFDLVEYVFDI